MNRLQIGLTGMLLLANGIAGCNGGNNGKKPVPEKPPVPVFADFKINGEKQLLSAGGPCNVAIIRK